jgi:hypothetical protein
MSRERQYNYFNSFTNLYTTELVRFSFQEREKLCQSNY